MTSSTPNRPLIWVVDDSPLDAERARRVLCGDHEVLVIRDASTALERMACGTWPDLLVLDWIMPGISGIDACRYLRGAESPCPNVAILLLTASNSPETVVEALNAGANDFLAKPFVDAELGARAAALVRSAQLLQKLQRSEATIRELVTTFPDALLTVDAGGRITFANDAAGQLFGVDPRALRDRPVRELMPQLARQDSVPQMAEGATVKLDDLVLGDRFVAATVRNTGIDDFSYTISLRDVTDSRTEQRRRLDFYSTVAHDLRSPLQAMLLRCGIMRGGRYGILPPALLADLQKMEVSVRSLNTLVNDFLDLARLEGAGLKLALTRVDVSQVVQDIIDELGPLAEANDVGLTFSIPAERPWAVADRRRLVQVMSNLLSNAIKFTGVGGHVQVLVGQVGATVQVGVRDNGPGIPTELLPRLFDRFTRAEGGDSKVAGTGLGLMIVRQIVEAHGGSVWVDSEVGRGSTFWFSLTLQPQQEAAV